jgi:esterase/lipase
MKILFVIVKWGFISLGLLAALATSYFTYVIMSFDTETLPENHGQVQSKLFLGTGDKQTLIVGLGGSEGGNAWAGDYWKEQRERFIAKNYAFLAIGYFGIDGTPANLDRIALDGVYRSIEKATNNSSVNETCIVVIGGSKGAELALLMGSYYPDIKAVIGIVPGNAVFAALTNAMTTSSYSINGEPLPFVPVPISATPELLTGDLRGAFTKMLMDKEAVKNAAIKVENINGAVLLLSAKSDEMWPSTQMSEMIVKRLEENNFPFPYRHIAYDGRHNAPLSHFDVIEEFLQTHIQSPDSSICDV